MKTTLLLALGLTLSFITTSCNFTENITVSQDGSGKASFDMDGSQLMAMAGGQMGDAKAIDSTFTFKEIFANKKDSIAKLSKAEQDHIKSLENLTVKIQMNAQEGQMNVNVLNNFKKVTEVSDVMQSFIDIARVKSPDKAEVMGFLNNHATVKYSYDGKTFKRNVEVAQNVVKQADSLNMYKSMLTESTYTINYKFPKKIKSVSNKTAVIGDDKQSLSVTYKLLDYLDNPTQLGLQVEFEK